MAELAALRPKTCSYRTDNNDKNKRKKSKKKCFIKQKLKFEDYKSCFEANQPEKWPNEKKNLI